MGRTPTAPRAVTFDVWYTLVYLAPEEEEGYVTSLVDAAGDLLRSWPAGPRGRPAPSLAVARRAFRREFEQAAWLSRRGVTCTPAQQIQAVADRLDRRARPDEYVRRIEELVDRLPLRAAPGAGVALRRVRAAGYRVGVVSNTVGEPGRALQKVLHRFGFAGQIQEWAWSDQHPWTKPAPELFRWCLRRLRVPPSRAIHVGDGWSDVVGAHRAGFRACVQFLGHASYSPSYAKVFAPPIPASQAADRKIRSFRGLPALVERLFGPGDVSRGRG